MSIVVTARERPICDRGYIYPQPRSAHSHTRRRATPTSDARRTAPDTRCLCAAVVCGDAGAIKSGHSCYIFRLRLCPDDRMDSRLLCLRLSRLGAAGGAHGAAGYSVFHNSRHIHIRGLTTPPQGLRLAKGLAHRIQLHAREAHLASALQAELAVWVTRACNAVLLR